MNYLDCFSGIGGFPTACQLADLHFDNHYYSEIDPYAIKVYAKNHPEAKPVGDITKLDAAALRAQHDGVWLLTGGFPCQDVSQAGKKRGLTGTRSSLWWELWRVIRDLRPAFAVIENVPGLRSQGLDRVLCGLAQIGYDAEWDTISAASVGAPHLRERVWVAAYPNGDRGKPGEDSSLASATRSCSTRTNVGDDKQSNDQAQGHTPWIDWQGAAATGTVYGEPMLLRVDDGIREKLHADRIRGLGNSIVPQVAARVLAKIKPYLS